MFLERKVGFTEHLRSLNPCKVVAMVIFPVIVQNLCYLAHTRSMHDIVCEFAYTVTMRRNNLRERP